MRLMDQWSDTTGYIMVMNMRRWLNMTLQCVILLECLRMMMMLKLQQAAALGVIVNNLLILLS